MFFGIIGLLIISGPPMHSRCRLTPFPVNISWTEDIPYEDVDKYRCLQAPNVDSSIDSDYHKTSSPWAKPVDNCFWPLDESNTRLCSFDNSGLNRCYHNTERLPTSLWRWCGSNFDGFGNPRFSDKDIMRSATFIIDLNYGYTVFDNIGFAVLTIFQCVTMEGWTSIMYMIQDSMSPQIGAFYFTVLIIIAAFGLVNILLAVLSNHFHASISERQTIGTQDRRPSLIAAVSSFSDSYFNLTKFSLMFSQLEHEYDWQVSLKLFLNSPVFSNTITASIVLNALALCLVHYPSESSFDVGLELINALFTFLFSIEMILKLCANGVIAYMRSGMNLFDATIVIVSLADIISSPPVLFGGPQNSNGGAITALRCFRIFRIFKMFGRWSNMRILVKRIVSIVNQTMNLIALLLLFLFICTLIGMQFFANRLRFRDNGTVIKEIQSEEWKNAGDWPRSNFDDFTHSFATVFQIMTTENWNNVMYDCWRATGPAATLFSIFMIIVGNYFLINLFMAIILNEFDNESDDSVSDTDEVVESNHRRKEALENYTLTNECMELETSVLSRNYKVVSSELVSGGTISPKNDEDLRRTGDLNSPENAPTNLFIVRQCFDKIKFYSAQMLEWYYFETLIVWTIIISCLILALDNPLLNPDDALPTALRIMGVIILCIFIVEMVLKIIVHGFIMSPTSYLRNGWNQIDFIVIVTSVIDVLLIGGGLDSLRALRALRALRPLRALRAFRAFRAFRALRPLRLVNRSSGLKVVINTIFASIPDVAIVFVLCFIFYVIFGIICVSYFKGGLRACQGETFDSVISPNAHYMSILINPKPWHELEPSEKDLFGYYSPLWSSPNDCQRGPDGSWPTVDQPCCTDYSTIASVITSKSICHCWHGVWGKQNGQSFDNIAEGLFTLFQMSTTEGWVDTMYAMTDNRGIDMQPVRDFSPGWVYFCVLFMIVGSFFALNVFVGVVVNNFNAMKKRNLEEGNVSVFMTEKQQAWAETYSILSTLKPKRVPTRPPRRHYPRRRRAFDICESSLFSNSIAWCIVLNTIVMSMNYFGESDNYGFSLQIMNLIFCIIFTAEQLLKLFAYQREFLEDYANIFDMFVVICIDIGIIVSFSESKNRIIVLLQILRIARLVKYASTIPSVGTMIDTVTGTISSIGNLSLLMLLLFFIYAVMGMNIFAKIEFGNNYDEHANFRDFGTSLLLLFRFATGESWNYVMYDMVASRAGCVTDPMYNASYCGFSDHPGCIPLNGCGSALAYPYMISFTVIISLVFINLFIGIVLEGFENANDLKCALTTADIKLFMECWSKYDPKGTFFITTVQLEKLIQNLPPSLQRSDHEFGDIKTVRKFIRKQLVDAAE